MKFLGSTVSPELSSLSMTSAIEDTKSAPSIYMPESIIDFFSSLTFLRHCTVELM